MLLKNYQQWTTHIDPDKNRAIADRSLWVFTLGLCVVTIYSFSSLPVLKDFIGLQPEVPYFILAVVALLAWPVSDEELGERIGLNKHLILQMFTTSSFQTLLWSWVIYSSKQAAPMMAAFPLLLTAYHCEFYLFSRKYFWALLPAFVSMTIALILSPSATHTTIVLVGGLLAVAGSFIMGSNALNQSQLRRERDDLKEALDASTLMDSVNEAKQTKDLLYEMMGANHDAGNAMTGLLMNLELLTTAIESGDENSELDIKELNQETLLSLKNLKQIIEKARNVGKEAHLRELVNTQELLENLTVDMKKQFSEIDLDLDLKNLNHANLIKLHGGKTSLQRIVTNLIKNAMEGNGAKSASRILVTASAKDNNLEIIISDNGPGFSEEQLNKSLSTVKSSKDQGTGLGLYTCKRLIQANKGELILENNQEGGAKITVRLPLSE